MNWWLIVFGIGVHLVFFYSIFDIYFTSPLVHGMTPQETNLEAPAKRLVLFIADGLRADKLFELDENGKTRAPYLRSIAQYHGAWGISHTRVPTESRPGNVAVIAGFYEDVSAIAKGWKENPVEFDSVFNESRYTWSWGSPDILPMFSKGASGDHVYTEMYPEESEDFAGANLGKLDTWVFDKVKDFVKQAEQNADLSMKFHQNKVVLFMHLLGLDTNGHAHKPYSSEYLDNIKLVDHGVKEMVDLINGYFNDDKTAFVFSSDHGMTNWGSHGAGHPSETLTPLIAWGAGVRTALEPTQQYTMDGFEKLWQMGSKRSDVNQADIAALMSALTGISFPLNSVGHLPVDYLSGSMGYKAENIFTNARQILQQFQVKMEQKQKTTFTILFTPFKELLPSKLTDHTRHIRTLIQAKKYEEAIVDSEDLIRLALEGLRYYHHYDRFFLEISILLGFLGWIMYIFTVLIQNHTTITLKRYKLEKLSYSFWISEKGIRIIFIIIGATVTSLLYVQSLPLTHYLYCIIPVILWHKVIQRYMLFQDLYFYIKDHGYMQKVAVILVLGLSGLEVIVLSFTYRELLSIALVAMAFWAFNSDQATNRGWILSILCLSIFPLLPVVGRQPNYYLVYLAGALTVGLALYSYLRKTTREESSALIVVQILVILCSIALVYSTQSSISQKTGLPLVNQLASWFVLALSFLLPLLSSTQVYERLTSIALAFIPSYLLLSTAYEGLFVLVLCGVMYNWLHLENNSAKRKIVKIEELDFCSRTHLGEAERTVMVTDIRCAYFFIFFLIAAFFGMGNIASINSFDPSSVLCFLTVFNPFIMGALMMWKNLIPFMLVTCTFNAVHLCVNVPTQSLFLLVVIMSDIMALNFFFLVQDYGSWLEIGTSISHYVIVMTTIIFINILLAVSKVFTNYRIGSNRRGRGQKEH